MARPIKYTEKVKTALLEKLDAYIEATEIPILKEFCALNGITFQRIYEFPEFSESMKKATDKKESALERLALQGKINTAMAIFSLKQLGWRDKQEFEHTGKDGGAIQTENVDKLKKVIDKMNDLQRKIFFDIIEQNNGLD